jgi:hypothetical protein
VAALALIPIHAQVTSDAADAGPASPCRPAKALPDPAAPDLDCPAPPNTFDGTRFFSANASPEVKAEAGPTYDSWAWASFAAMNWPAEWRGVSEELPTGFERGVPSGEESFADAAADRVAVWETFKEKRELFHPLPTATPPGKPLPPDAEWQDVTFDDSQVPSQLGGKIEPCTGVDPSRLSEGHHRFLAQGVKHPSVDGSQALDETVQVASPALEKTSVLCAGYDATTNPTLEYCQTLLFRENPPQAVDGRTPVGPRVWKGNPSEPGARPIFFEVKVNYDFWRYVLDRGFQVDDVATEASLSTDVDQHPKLPFRTSASKGPGRSSHATFGYDAEATAARYGDLGDPNALPGIGSVQVKAAWLLLDEKERKGGKFHTTEAVYYQTDDQDPGKLCYRIDTFGLLGLHIIQRVHSQPFRRSDPNLFAHGGTFIFATWEHTSLEVEPTGYYYANFFAFSGPLGTSGKYPFDIETTPFPNFRDAPGGAIPVVRQKPYPLATTAAVNAAVHARLPRGSVWRNYRLIGTQFVALGSEKESEAYNQPHFLANLVVETNEGLQHFKGLPPGVFEPSDPPTAGDITPYYTQKVTLQGTNTAFDRELANVVFNRELRDPVNMGGCMGCHGVAQLRGFNFSFVFAAGSQGANVDTQQSFEVAGAKTD